MDTFVRQGHENTKFFIGTEIEHTPAFGKKTLFVVGLQDTAEVERLARTHKTSHVFLSANRSFDSLANTPTGYMVGDTLASDWESQIQELLSKGFMVSLDYPAHKHVDVLKVLNPSIWQSRNFVPVLSVAIPKVNTSNINLTIKIDDSNFNATNPGVWCMNHNEATDSNRFTSWNEYGNDIILNEENIPTPKTDNSFREFINNKNTSVAEVRIDANVISELAEVGIDAVAEVNSAIQNDATLGLDLESTSQLKPDEVMNAKSKDETTTDVIASYVSESNTELTADSDAKEAPKKKTTKVKA